MAELKGTFYGVSVGPGDPELLTLQAVRLIRKCPVLAAPQTSSGQMLALDIARSALGEALDGKTIIPLHFAMSRDPAVLAASHKEAVQAARLNVPLTGGMDAPLTIAPGSWAGRMLDTPGTKVLMKTGRQLPALLAALEQAGRLENSALVCNCGLPDEQVCPDLSLGQPQVQPGYFTTVLVKE